MDFNQVRYFLALADSLNFTRAAEHCYVSQPALTQAIKRLETELGGELIHRDGRYTELTELGKSLRSHFEQIDRTRHIVRKTAKAVITGEISELNIGIMCTIGPRIISGLLDTFYMDHPKVSIVLHDVTTESIEDLLLSGVIDGAFYASHQDRLHPKLKYIELFKENMVITFHTGHRFSKLNEVDFLEIGKENYVDRLHCEFRDEFFNLLNENNLDIKVVFRCQREDWIQNLVCDGVGVSIIPQYSLLRSELDYRHVTAPSLTRDVKFVTVDHSKHKPAIKHFIEHAKNFNWPIN